EAYILVVTSYPDRDYMHRDRALEAGANGVAVRHELLADVGEWSFESLTWKIREHLVSRGLISLGRLVYDENDVRITSILERLGSRGNSEAERVAGGVRVVHNLAMGCLRQPRIDEADFYASYLTPGRSGAHVCRIDMSMMDQPNESFVLKFGLDRQAL